MVKETNFINIAQKVELRLSNEQRTYFHRAMGCARKAYNVCLAESKKWYDEGRKWNRVAMNNWFNSIKDEYFPYMREVTKFAPQYAIMNLDAAFKNFFSGCNKRNNKGRKIKFGFPKFKRKNQNRGGFTIGGNGVHFSEDKVIFGLPD